MGKAKLPGGLFISVSQVKSFLTCPAAFFFRYVRREEPAFLAVNLAFGTAIHTALAAYYLELKHRQEPLRRDLVLDVFRDAWDKAAEGPVPLQPDDEDDDNLDQLIDKGVAMLHAFHEHAAQSVASITVEAVEHSFAVSVTDPTTGDVLEEQLVGVIDAVIQEGGRRAILEHKTAAKKYSGDQLRYDPQPTAYKLAARASGLGEVALRYQVITKTKVPAVQVADVHRDARDEADFLKTVVGVLRAVEAGVDYPVRGWACRSCPYQHTCRSPS